MSTLRTLAQGLVSLLPPRLQIMAHWRFIKFGLVGASGTVVNIAVLYLAQEHLLQGIADFHARLNYSIALAITLATLSNFYWNRRLTWRDRTGSLAHQSTAGLLLKYVMAAALSIAIQSLLTKWLALHLHYLLANVLAIVVASAVNFLANDRLTFRRHGTTAQPSRTALASGFAPAQTHEKP